MSDGSAEGAAIAGAIEMLKMGKENAHLKKAGDNLAFAGEVLTGLLKTALMPLAVVNARAQTYFDSKFPEDLAQKMRDVPPEEIRSPKPSVAGPVLQGLGYSHEEENLRDLYLSLLATAMDGRSASSAHPGFAEIIGALSADEVPFLNIYLPKDTAAIAELRVHVEGSQGWTAVYRHLVNVVTSDKVPLTNEMLPAFIDNWVRLGLVDVDYQTYLTADNTYAWVESRPEFVQAKNVAGDGIVSFERGVMRPTAFGKAFANAVGIR